MTECMYRGSSSKNRNICLRTEDTKGPPKTEKSPTGKQDTVIEKLLRYFLVIKRRTSRKNKTTFLSFEKIE